MRFIDLPAQQRRIRADIERRIAAVLDHGAYVFGPEVAELERRLAAFCGARHAVACANGTDALVLGLRALGAGPGDAVFCPTFTFAATAEAPALVGATPVFVDVDETTFDVDPASLERSIAHASKWGLRPAGVIPVDLFGLPANYDALEPIAEARGMWIMADAAQSFGAEYHGRIAGSIGKVATTSFFPAKPLGCYGDGGCVFTSDDAIAETVRSLRNHGQGADKYENVQVGYNSRLDTLQAAILLAKLEVFPSEIEARRKVAERYRRGLGDVLNAPIAPEGRASTWAQYTVQLREGQYRGPILERLARAGVPTAIYYPVPLHRQTAFADRPADPMGLIVAERLAARVFSLPMHADLDEATQDRVIEAVLAATEAR